MTEGEIFADTFLVADEAASGRYFNANLWQIRGLIVEYQDRQRLVVFTDRVHQGLSGSWELNVDNVNLLTKVWKEANQAFDTYRISTIKWS